VVEEDHPPGGAVSAEDLLDLRQDVGDASATRVVCGVLVKLEYQSFRQ